MLGDVYYDPRHEAAFGTLEKLIRVAKKTGVEKPGQVKPWLEQQDAYCTGRICLGNGRTVASCIGWTTYTNPDDYWVCDHFALGCANVL